jgi:hypothetical protein
VRLVVHAERYSNSFYAVSRMKSDRSTSMQTTKVIAAADNAPDFFGQARAWLRRKLE